MSRRWVIDVEYQRWVKYTFDGPDAEQEAVALALSFDPDSTDERFEVTEDQPDFPHVIGIGEGGA